MDSLLLGIARCPNVTLARCAVDHPCHQIVNAQRVPPDRFHLPEPWNGDLRSAPLLFVSSNPAIGEDEDYPTVAWSDEHVHDYFTNRFGGGLREWTKNANRGLRVDGTYGRWSPFWSAIRARAQELFDREVTPGRDFALTEIVHCKSLGEVGVRTASDECAGRHLMPVLEAAKATVIVGLGKVAAQYLRGVAVFDGDLSPPVRLGRMDRRIVLLPHPNARRHRTFSHCITPEFLDLLREWLRRS